MPLSVIDVDAAIYTTFWGLEIRSFCRRFRTVNRAGNCFIALQLKSEVAGPGSQPPLQERF